MTLLGYNRGAAGVGQNSTAQADFDKSECRAVVRHKIMRLTKLQYQVWERVSSSTCMSDLDKSEYRAVPGA
jgi:hypothetical protein